MGPALFRVYQSTGCGCQAGHNAHGGFEMFRVSAESLLACRKRLANMNSYSVFIVASVITLPKVSDICFLWLAGVIFILRGQFFIPKPLAEERMLLVLVLGGAAAALVHPVNLSVRAEDEVPVADSTGHCNQTGLWLATSLML